MADEKHVAEGSRWIVVADQQHEQSGLTGFIYALGLDNAQDQAIALFGVILLSWGLMRLARWGLDRHTVAKAPPAPARVGHAVAASVAKAPRGAPGKVRIKTRKYAEPGRSFATSLTRRCAWKQLQAAADGTGTEWFCTRCSATCTTEHEVSPGICLRTA
ncbi:hypothetical protein L0V05_10190 [Tabrizicola sp. J26]|uniref:hypothetical protein n=1 Tax=Alitabrizicola rongguiensis TaxID=2909234 RepID=UPI001F2FD1A2|nr:hypothetical protein [Tabrizicola rongguiensis]MCF1709186.1 hypothetical protein [Tabrizicola rongguiensis]